MVRHFTCTEPEHLALPNNLTKPQNILHLTRDSRRRPHRADLCR